MKVPPTLKHPSPRAKIWDGVVPGTHEPGFVEQPIIELEIPEHVRRLVHPDYEGPLFRFAMGECTIMLGHEPTFYGNELRWHLTISCPDRHPSWDEIKVAKYRLTGPDLPMAILLPPAVDYVNVVAQDHVFQIYEIVDECRPWI